MKLLKDIIGIAIFFALMVAMGVFGNTCGDDGRQNCLAYSQGAR